MGTPAGPTTEDPTRAPTARAAATEEAGFWDDADVIYSYTREDAIRDGVLVDVTPLARDSGFRIPVAITSGVHAQCEPPKGAPSGQDYTGRCHDVLWMASRAYNAKLRRLRAQGMSHDQMKHEMGLTEFQVLFQDKPRRMEKKTLWLTFNEHEGFTILFPEEY